MDASQKRVVADQVSASPIVSTYRREIIATLLTGVVVGAIVFGVYHLLNQFVFGSVLCRPGNDASCASAPTYSMAVSLVLAVVLGLIGLMQIRSYRPLLIVLAIAVSYWGYQVLITGVAWYWGVLIGAILFGLSYLLFSWIARIRSFAVSLVLTIILVILVRLALVS